MDELCRHGNLIGRCEACKAGYRRLGMEEVGEETPAKTTDFHKPDGSLLIRITLGPVKHYRQKRRP